MPDWKFEHYAQSEFLRRLFTYLSIDCVFDVGANAGQFGMFLRNQVDYNGLIISFEPNPSCLSELRRKASLDGKWIVNAYALGSDVGTAQFNLMAADQFSSFLEPSHRAPARFTRATSITTTIEVQVRRLHDVVGEFFAKHDVAHPYLKLDTQGFDLEVARGAGDALARFSALQTEASATPIYERSPNFAESIAFLSGAGFELSAIFPNNPGHFPRMIEFDCHMINSRLVEGDRPA